MDRNIIIIGASGHGKVIADIAVACGRTIKGFLDDDRTKKECYGYPVLGSVDMVEQFSECDAIIAIGNNAIRKKIADTYKSTNYAVLIHPSAVVSQTAQLKEGTAIMPNVVVNADASVGTHCIINTGAIVEHDCKIGNYVHISPNATICGTCIIGDQVWIGANGTVINNKSVGSNVVVGASAVVLDDIIEEGTYVGVPARKI